MGITLLDAAERILAEAGEPLHYKELTRRIIESGRWQSAGRTPEHSLNAQVGTDIKQRRASGLQPRFDQPRKGSGYIGLSAELPTGLAAEVDRHNRNVRAELLRVVQEMHWEQFELLVETLLVVMGFQDVIRTRGTRDKGVDVRGTLVVAGAIRVPFAVQVKQQKGNVGSPKIQELRGSQAADERGLFVTTSRFTKGARHDAEQSGRKPIALIDGEKLAELLVEHAERLKEEAEANERDDLRELVVERGPVVLLDLDQPKSSPVDA